MHILRKFAFFCVICVPFGQPLFANNRVLRNYILPFFKMNARGYCLRQGHAKNIDFCFNFLL